MPRDQLTLFSFHDFITEAKESHITTIRLQSSLNHRNDPRISLTAVKPDSNLLLTCQITVRHCQIHNGRNFPKALRLIRQRLLDLSFDIRPGKYWHVSMGHATARGLWTFDSEGHLVPAKTQETFKLRCNNPHCYWEGTTADTQHYPDLDEYSCPGCGGFDMKLYPPGDEIVTESMTKAYQLGESPTEAKTKC